MGKPGMKGTPIIAAAWRLRLLFFRAVSSGWRGWLYVCGMVKVMMMTMVQW
jgi:hypothetical protein